MKLVLGISSLVMFALVAGARGESLAEAARREKERREKNRATGVMTRVVGPEEVSTFEDAPAVDATQDQSPSQPQDARVEPPVRTVLETPSQEAMWRERAQSARKRLDDAQRQYDQAMSQGQYKPGACLPAQTRHASRVAERQRRAKDFLDQAKRDMADLEEHARRTGALPGWLR